MLDCKKQIVNNNHSQYLTDFKNNGFCIIPKAIDQSLVDMCNYSIDSFLNKNKPLLKQHNLLPNGMLQRAINLHRSIKPLQKVFCEAMDSGSLVCDMHGQATLHTSLFFELGSQQPLHRDTPYFYSGTDNGYMGVWVALDDVDEENGALVAIEGSHKLPEADLEKLKNKFYPNEDVPPSCTELFNAYNDEILALATQAGLRKVVCNVNKGDMIIWNPATLHGGLPHHDTNRTRRSFVMHITPKNMPMMHMDYFFHPDREVPKINKDYIEVGERLVSNGDHVDFMHKKTFSVEELSTF
ncbi:phytanoyl-CoA dioxygenase family protein [Vibrio tubiashii]|uniref:phytanoyl-CoA dioxygenase family protein n=1 Tax=Vibrio tubiashii TaxID=29498 RepID=UPI00234E6037|nr:phytanoyl-CoA dioxygenase family protein [Vibrio tubiashii]WCP69059.1 phytanoyl-CoA dioxygenase family protein [Vibrio tubiashii]